jgi:hypothetical protein
VDDCDDEHRVRYVDCANNGEAAEPTSEAGLKVPQVLAVYQAKNRQSCNRPFSVDSYNDNQQDQAKHSLLFIQQDKEMRHKNEME